MRPVLDRLIVRKDDTPKMTPGGLHIPENVRTKDENRSLFAEVIAVGPGRVDKHGRLRPVELKPGDRVLYHRDAGWDLYIKEDPRLMMLEEKDVLGVVE